VSPVLRYTLARVGLFLVALVAVWPLPVNALLKLMIAILVSAALAFFLLRRWRDEVAGRLAGGIERRRAQRERLHAALAGEDVPDPAGANGDGEEAAGPAGRPLPPPPPPPRTGRLTAGGPLDRGRAA
jgi:hypothetical protein